jgi:hypothetical protein
MGDRNGETVALETIAQLPSDIKMDSSADPTPNTSIDDEILQIVADAATTTDVGIDRRQRPRNMCTDTIYGTGGQNSASHTVCVGMRAVLFVTFLFFLKL